MRDTERFLAAAVLPLFLGSCGLFGPSQEQRTMLAAHTRNAVLYYEGGNFNQALDQIRRGLALDSENYKLKTIRAWCTLRMTSNDRRLIEQCEQQFDELHAMRRPKDHSPQALLGYALIQQRIGLVHQEQALSLRDDMARADTADQASREPRAKEHQLLARTRFKTAEATLKVMIDRGDELTLAHYHLMQTAGLQGHYAEAVAAGNEFLKINKGQQQDWQRTYESTGDVSFESWSSLQLQQLVDREIEVRAHLANLHFKNEQYQAAVAELDQALLLDPTRSDDYFNRAYCYEKLGRAAESRRDFERFLAMTRLPQGNSKVTHALKVLQPR